MVHPNGMCGRQQSRFGGIAYPLVIATGLCVVAQQAGQQGLLKSEIDSLARIVHGPEVPQWLENAGGIDMLDRHPVLGERPCLV